VLGGDEVLAVATHRFKGKCQQRIEELRAVG